MIFLTLGTTVFPFPRLISAVDQALSENRDDELLIAQIGSNNYKFHYKNAQIFKEISYEKMLEFFKKARLVITHGGLASVVLSLRYGLNQPLVIPRYQKMGEHVDDHEVFFTKFMEGKKLIKALYFPEDLPLKIKSFLRNPERNHGLSDSHEKENLILNLKKITSSLDKCPGF